MCDVVPLLDILWFLCAVSELSAVNVAYLLGAQQVRDALCALMLSPVMTSKTCRHSPLHTHEVHT